MGLYKTNSYLHLSGMLTFPVWHLKWATPHHEPSEVPSKEWVQFTPALLDWNVGKRQVCPLDYGFPVLASAGICLEILIRKDSFRNRRKLAPGDGLTHIKCHKVNKIDEVKRNLSYYKLKTLSVQSTPSDTRPNVQHLVHPKWYCFQNTGHRMSVVKFSWFHVFNSEITVFSYVIQVKEYCPGSLWPLEEYVTLLPPGPKVFFNYKSYARFLNTLSRTQIQLHGLTMST